jgi:hypothetical protein
MTTNQARAEQYLDQAAELVHTPRVGVARTLAEMAQAAALLTVADAINADRTRVEHTDVRLSPTVERALLRRIGA